MMPWEVEPEVASPVLSSGTETSPMVMVSEIQSPSTSKEAER